MNAPTTQQINRIVNLLRSDSDSLNETGWHEEPGWTKDEQRPIIIFGSGTWPEYRRGVYVDEIVLALERYDKRFIGAGI